MLQKHQEEALLKPTCFQTRPRSGCAPDSSCRLLSGIKGPTNWDVPQTEEGGGGWCFPTPSRLSSLTVSESRTEEKKLSFHFLQLDALSSFPLRLRRWRRLLPPPCSLLMEELWNQTEGCARAKRYQKKRSALLLISLMTRCRWRFPRRAPAGAKER